jgi:hypothetical protein
MHQNRSHQRQAKNSSLEFKQKTAVSQGTTPMQAEKITMLIQAHGQEEIQSKTSTGRSFTQDVRQFSNMIRSVEHTFCSLTSMWSESTRGSPII